MKPCKLKICGLSRLADIEAVNQILPDYIGFVFAKSRRQVTLQQAAGLKAALDKRIQAAGVFVNASLEEILTIGDTIDVIQLHGDEDAAYMEALRAKTSKPIIKAIRVESRQQIEQAQKLPCDYLLLDTFTKDQYGGSGKQFDWGLIPALAKPYFLAGGINEDNLSRAMSYHPYCIDISSAVETDGVKDAGKMKRFAEKFL